MLNHAKWASSSRTLPDELSTRCIQEPYTIPLRLHEVHTIFLNFTTHLQVEYASNNDNYKPCLQSPTYHSLLCFVSSASSKSLFGYFFVCFFRSLSFTGLAPLWQSWHSQGSVFISIAVPLLHVCFFLSFLPWIIAALYRGPYGKQEMIGDGPATWIVGSSPTKLQHTSTGTIIHQPQSTTSSWSKTPSFSCKVLPWNAWKKLAAGNTLLFTHWSLRHEDPANSEACLSQAKVMVPREDHLCGWISLQTILELWIRSFIEF